MALEKTDGPVFATVGIARRFQASLSEDTTYNSAS